MTQASVDRQALPAAPTDADIAACLDELDASPQANLIGVLQETQDRFGYLSSAALRQVSRRMKIPLSRVYGVVSFYAQFYTEPHGRHTIRCCRGTACHVRGVDRVIEAIEAKLGITEGQTTPDMKFYLEFVACLGTCFLAPVIMIDERYFGQLTAKRVETLLDNFSNGEA